MTALAILENAHLPMLVRKAAEHLASAETAAEVLQARDVATEAYDQAKRAARLAKAKGAHDTLIMTIYRVQAEGLEIEAAAKRRLADEYDAAQERGEAETKGRPKNVPDENIIPPATTSEMKISRKEIHDARQLRDAEALNPGVTKRAIDNIVEQGREPTRAAVRREISPGRQPQYQTASDQSLWIWGRLCDFERKGILSASPHEILGGMVPHMVVDVHRIAPLLRNLLEELEVALEHA
jgi:hypothetical protein